MQLRFNRWQDIRTGFYGMLILTLGMGIGRFLFTPILPLMLNENRLDFTQLSWLASGNYAGYLAGSLFFSINRTSRAAKQEQALFFSALATVFLLLALAFINQYGLVLIIRFLAGVASAGMMIFGSMMVLHRNENSNIIIAMLYSGVGIGIVLGNEYVIQAANLSIHSSDIWLGAAIMAIVLLLLLAILVSFVNHANYKSAGRSMPQHRLSPLDFINWKWLAALYGLAGFGYIITATYLPLMVSQNGSTFLSERLWSILGLSIIPGCILWRWIAHRIGLLHSLRLNLSLQAICVLIGLFNQSSLLLILSAVGVGLTFMGTTALVLPLAKQLSTSKRYNLLGLVTLTYGIGQILGPLIVALFSQFNSPFIPAIASAAIALFVAAWIVNRAIRANSLKAVEIDEIQTNV